MKNTLISIAIAIIIMIVACQKNEMMNNTFGVDTKDYENKLSIDYSNALLNHNALSTTSAASTIDNSYYKMMFNRNDSLFSQHFYEFCVDMMQNSGMMRYMDSLHLSTGALMNPDYMKTDSLMYNQMTNCNMMSPETDSIVNVYGNMQMLRKNHKTFHGN